MLRKVIPPQLKTETFLLCIIVTPCPIFFNSLRIGAITVYYDRIYYHLLKNAYSSLFVKVL